MKNPRWKVDTKKVQTISPEDKPPQGASLFPSSLWRNRYFTIFGIGQTLSSLGDAFALVAMPLLVFQATGSVTQMGIVTGIYSIGQVVAGFFSGSLVDRVERRTLMIGCDVLRFLLYATIPLCWLVGSPSIWLLYAVSALGSCLGFCFQVVYTTAIANLVAEDQIIDANSRLQVTFAVAYVFGPMLAGLISAHFGAAIAIGLDAFSFLFSALSLLYIRFPSRSGAVSIWSYGKVRKNWLTKSLADFFLGGRFLFQHAVLRSITLLFMAFSLATAAGINLFVFHLKHDLQQDDSVVGLILCLASVGSIVGGSITPLLRRRLGFSAVWLGGICLEGIFVALIGPTSLIALMVFFTMGFTFSDTVMRVSWMSLRQRVTPDALLGRVTAVFWTLSSIPALLGSVLTTFLASILGTPSTLIGIGVFVILIALIGCLTPIRARWSEKAFWGENA
jgi:MFS family permease